MNSRPEDKGKGPKIMAESPNPLENMQILPAGILAELNKFSTDHGLVQVPPQYAEHRLLKNQIFFILPQDLLAILEKDLGSDRFDLDLWKLEKTLSEQWKPGSLTVGFWDGKPIRYEFLQREPFQLKSTDAQMLGMTEAERKNVQRVGESRLSFFSGVAQGYCGWLLLNPLYRKEEAAFLRTWAPQIVQYGIRYLEIPGSQNTSLPWLWKKADDTQVSFAEATREFLIRWRLMQLPAPYLPHPLSPQLPAMVPRLLLGYMREGGSILYYPDIYPIPSRDELRQILEECAARANVPEHLQEWQNLVRAGNSAKNAISHLGRIFELQHFWRILHRRHSLSLKDCKQKLEQVFGQFLDISSDTIDKDLRHIEGALGKDWVTEVF